MGNYLDVIKIAIAAFPTIAFLISLPFILHQYHRHGSIAFWKVVVLYSFALYLTCAYFLVILPLPSFEEVAQLTTPRTQLIPFSFVGDFFTHTQLNLADPSTYLPALTEAYFFVPIYNIVLTLPFGIYLHYYFRRDLKQTVVATFLLSLFFELTQLTGLYFIYPRGYRLFDVDDLILNTLGGVIGFFLAEPLMKVLPDPAQINAQAEAKSKVVSGFRRTVAFGVDAIFCLIIATVIILLTPSSINHSFIFYGTAIVYYFILPLCLHSSTPVQSYLHLRVVDQLGQENFLKLWCRRLFFIGIYFGLPSLIIFLVSNFMLVPVWREFVILALIASLVVFYIVTFFKLVFTNRPLIYERLSQTHLISIL